MTQKVIITPKQCVEITCNPNILQQSFLRNLERGITSPRLHSEIKHNLKLGNSDKALITVVTRVAAAERERVKTFAVRSRKNKGGVFTVSTTEYQSDNESFAPNKMLRKLFEKFNKSIFEMENKLKSPIVYTQRQGLGNMHHNRDLRCTMCKEKSLNDCQHCFKCREEGDTARFCSIRHGN